MKIAFREVLYGSPEYQTTLQLRDAVLRKPLGLAFSKDQLAAEAKDTHLTAWYAGKIVACLVLTPQHDATLKMRQVAVEPALQGRGIGRQLVLYSEQWAKQHGYCTLYCHARETAVPFYVSLGYQVKRGPFEEVTLPHFLLEKNLTD